ncbi:hypothetical protein KCP76_05875 [Salmonella enterica subsp. enterica serovar Weltevreden]|nr:hypothetical protein KCP76_05875 [Salmonella enterica subsp. enterica serovar Weltevreden]
MMRGLAHLYVRCRHKAIPDYPCREAQNQTAPLKSCQKRGFRERDAVAILPQRPAAYRRIEMIRRTRKSSGDSEVVREGRLVGRTSVPAAIRRFLPLPDDDAVASYLGLRFRDD